MVEDTADSLPIITSPVIFLVKSFLYLYTTIIVLLYLYGLYAWYILTIPLPKKRLIESGEIETNIKITDNKYSSDTLISDDDKSLFQTKNNKLQILSSWDLSNSCLFDDKNLWEGDWNRYWNCKADY